MYSRNTFGSYYPVNSIVHRLNPIIKLINFIIILVLSIISNSIYINSFILILVFILILLSYVPFKYYIDTIWSLRYIYILIAFICAYFGTNMQECIVYLMKITSVVEYLYIITYTTSPSESAYGIEKFLSFFNIFNLPISLLSFRINLLIRYLPLSTSVENKMLKAVSSRGMDYYYTNIFVRMWISLKLHFNKKRLVKLKNKQIGNTYARRLFSLKRYRTNYRTNKIGFYDIFFLLFHIILILLYLKDKGVIL